jgi:phage tail sheath protein FI
MAFSVSPSVIVREVDASQSVPAVATPPAAIAGVFRWGPTNDPILITSENDLVDRFGKPTDDNYETFFTAADYLSYSNALYVVRADDSSNTATATNIVYDSNNNIVVADTTYGGFEAKYPGSLGNSLEVAWVDSSGYSTEWFDVGGVDANAVSNTQAEQTVDFGSTSVSFETANTVQLPALGIGDVLKIGNSSVGYQELVVSAYTETEQERTYGSGNTAVTVVESYKYDISFSNKYTLAESDLSKLSVSRNWQYASSFGKAPDADHLHIAVIDKGGEISGTEGQILEKFENVSTSAAAVTPQGASNYFANVVENRSEWIKNANTAHVISTVTDQTASTVYENFVGGADASTETTATLSTLAFAWDTLKNGNEIDISGVLQGKGDNDGIRANYIVSNICDTRKDCVAYISPSKEAVVDELKTNAKMENAIAYRNKIQNSSYWFMDSGYKYRYDKYNDVYRYTPLNGDMAGLASRVESWESPAGFRKGVIKNVIKLAFNPGKAQRDLLYGSDINPVMSQVGQGIVLFGDKTGLGTTSAFDRLNVRRLFIDVEKAIATAAESFLFEFNDEFTQSRFRNIVEPFLRDIQGRRGIIDFRVVSDSTVNTPEVIDANKFRASIFIKPARSINVIELTFVATRTGVEFDEIVGQLG